MNFLLRLFRSICKPDDYANAVEPVRPRVTPDVERAAELQRRRDALAWRHDGFMPTLPPKVRERTGTATVTQIRKRG